MVQFSGMYRHDKDENLQEVLAKIGVGLVLRKVMTAAKPSIEVKAGEGEGDTWTIIITTPVKTITITFILGQETEIDTPDSGKNKVVFSLEGDTLIQRPVDASGEKAVEVVREFSDDGLTQTMHHLASGTKGSRAFKREAP